ncbi:D-lactate dehydrogenase [Sphingomonas psychrotolerans]|uniref:Quinone-dependent D-lactate dehydrogenase n=1 Tax=Sphingomonas psychrotolerans TaxID=1327635 RepID=A0A2K8MN61_9SPHN|nr:D-lactate dehydrogenase [Sphingomonas psychrotolerans]ATY34594.1 D-lactate dehydrogenase [Sphingomonas psychrotolerans]
MPVTFPLSKTDDTAALLDRLRGIVGRRHVLASDRETHRHRTGFRFGSGPVLAVVRPGTMVEQWRVLQACIAAGVIVIPQAANTGLTGGSTPHGAYDRPVVVINTLRIKGLHLIREGAQVIALPGTTLYELEARLRPLGREPHSVIGSSCIGASVMGGVCNNSGGALVRRGPAYTELALYAQVDEHGVLSLVNHLGIALGNDPVMMLDRLERGAFAESEVTATTDRAASDPHYGAHVRAIDADTPARFNADPSRLFEASGSAGKVMVFAVRLDTFPKEARTRVFYIGTSDPAELAELRRTILSSFAHLPIAAEYMHREAFDIAARYGKDTYLAIRHLGTDRLPLLYAIKARVDSLAARLPFLGSHLSDRMLQWLADRMPDHLPARMGAWRDCYEHHLVLRIAEDGVAEVRAALSARYPSAAGDWFECTQAEGDAAFLHRFAAAGAAIRYRQIHGDAVEDIVALDIALPRNTQDWFERLPEALSAPILHKLYYGHFLCHVFHQDYIVRKGTDPLALEHAMWALLDRRGAEYPAEHNVGHLYPAKPALRAHYLALDPCNMFNPGIGHTSREAAR